MGVVYANQIFVETRVWKEINTDQDVERPRLLAHTATKIGSFLFVVGGHNTNKYTDDVRMLNLRKLATTVSPVFVLSQAGFYSVHQKLFATKPNR